MSNGEVVNAADDPATDTSLLRLANVLLAARRTIVLVGLVLAFVV